MDAVDAADSLMRRTAHAAQLACHVTLVIIEKVASRRLLNAQVDATASRAVISPTWRAQTEFFLRTPEIDD